MRVLIAVDGSEGSFDAVRQVAPLLSEGRDTVALYCRPPQVQVRSAGTGKELLDAAEQSLANAVFAEARKHLGPRFESKTHTIIGHKDPRNGIVLASQQWSADMIVVGARGLGTFERLFLGSVSRAVVHASGIPVWVARANRGTTDHGLRVLWACESPEAARRPAEVLSQLSWPDDASFLALTVTFSIFAGNVPQWLQQKARSPDVEAMVQTWAREHDAELQESAARMKAFLTTMPTPLRDAHTEIAEGDPAHMILETASREHSNLVVVGTRQKWSAGSAILGRVSEAVLNHAPCSVLVIPHLEQP